MSLAPVRKSLGRGCHQFHRHHFRASEYPVGYNAAILATRLRLVKASSTASGGRLAENRKSDTETLAPDD
jgi:hypothetical protein